MLESTIEAYLVKRVEALGGIALKADKTFGRRFLDRICILPDGVVIFVECKRPKGGRWEAHQVVIVELLRVLGHRACFISTKEEVDAALEG